MTAPTAPITTPIPTILPTVEPQRRLEPSRLCPNQQERITRRIDRELVP